MKAPMLSKCVLASAVVFAISIAFMACDDGGLAGPEPVPETRPTAPAVWGPCPTTGGGIGLPQECATITVPLDYHDQRRGIITVAISRVRASKPELRRGVLLLNPGGPGGRGLDLPGLAALALPASVLERYDLIGFDPRFVGRSTPLTCGLDQAQATATWLAAEQPGGFSATIPFMRAVADSCARTAGELLAFSTTANTARDLDRIREALGEPSIAYLGYSYGTYLGAVYAAMFPSHTDRFILDSAIDPHRIWRDQFRQWGPAGELRFGDLAAFAAAHDNDYHLGATPEQVRARFLDLVAQLDGAPVPLLDGAVLDGAMFRSATFQFLYEDADLPSAAQLWHLIAELPSDPTLTSAIQQAFAVLDDVPPAGVPIDNIAASSLAIVCGDVAWPRSVEQYRRERDSDAQRYPLFGTVGSSLWPCAFWASSPIEPAVAITSTGPRNILMLENLRDPAAPYAAALGMSRALGQRATVVTVDQGGHGVLLVTPDACAADAAVAFLVEGRLPATDLFCPASPATAIAHHVAPAPDGRDGAIRELRRRVR